MLLHYLEKCNRIHFFTKTVEEICNACGNFIVVKKQEILVISLTDFFDAASRHHKDVILLPAIRRVSGNDFVFQQDSGIPEPRITLQSERILSAILKIVLSLISFFCFSNAVWASASGGWHIVSDTLVIIVIL